ncbi:hypothetical protein HanRHA438_Chr17g0808181 [Helianthus annuus]|nr:hypothetical protein HanHA89_Chr17g0702341 [Helianthus annuus]KAJ0632078.1 hypothetical protein HanLR1_Chr17g0661041 [Helianthus annuus]KAJ0812786.1 hypothetical protein HanPSC8_Chr17g0765891 [Helianthus annuus]KAJ0825893.1 hypothetical protein HanRHA438_Chr17g0808181 [Helianthus annuus]
MYSNLCSSSSPRRHGLMSSHLFHTFLLSTTVVGTCRNHRPYHCFSISLVVVTE